MRTEPCKLNLSRLRYLRDVAGHVPRFAEGGNVALRFALAHYD